MEIITLTDIENCSRAWSRYWPVTGLFDLWPVRHCFHQAFHRPLHFVLAVSRGRVVGFLPLCRVTESDTFVMFPGETWHGHTWIEQNRLLAASSSVMSALLAAVPGPVHLRYLVPDDRVEAPDPLDRQNIGGSGFGRTNAVMDGTGLDEVGYLFYPKAYGYDFNAYLNVFSHRSRKKMAAALEKLGQLSFRYDHSVDLAHLYRFNLDRYGRDSYFHDPRFKTAFDLLAVYLRQSGLGRVTTLLADNRIAAVDLGACYNDTYTLLAGGTDPDLPGVAKAINLHHMEWACNQQMDGVDFLCGDFNWKSRFHLTPRPLYRLVRPRTDADTIHAAA